MKQKIRFLVIFGFFLCMCCADLSCGSKYFLINSEGIATYNKQTGQFEIAWDTKTHSNQVVHDTVYVDSCRVRE